MALPIVKIGHPVLRKKCVKLNRKTLKDPTFYTFLKNMVLTMRQAQGVGIAANQVGCGLQAFALECGSNERYPRRGGFPLEIYLNPRILHYSKDKADDWEGCLSIPGYRGRVPRSKKIIFEAWTLAGQRVRKTLSGFQARVVQHEVDHLNGLFYMNRMKGLRHWTHLEEFNRKFRLKVKE